MMDLIPCPSGMLCLAQCELPFPVVLLSLCSRLRMMLSTYQTLMYFVLVLHSYIICAMDIL